MRIEKPSEEKFQFKPEDGWSIVDSIIPEVTPGILYTVISYWWNARNYGVCFAQELDLRSHFYPVKRFNVVFFDTEKEVSDQHQALSDHLDWRTVKKEVSVDDPKK